MPGECQQHQTMMDSIKNFDKKLDEILKRLGNGDVNFATISLRIKLLEIVVYGAVSIGLIAVARALVAGVFK